MTPTFRPAHTTGRAIKRHGRTAASSRERAVSLLAQRTNGILSAIWRACGIHAMRRLLPQNHGDSPSMRGACLRGGGRSSSISGSLNFGEASRGSGLTCGAGAAVGGGDFEAKYTMALPAVTLARMTMIAMMTIAAVRLGFDFRTERRRRFGYGDVLGVTGSASCGVGVNISRHRGQSTNWPF